MKRIILCAAATAALLAVPSLADARARHHRVVHHSARHSGRNVNTYTGYRGGDTSQGNAAVDNLNAQSLARARGTTQ